MDRDSVFVKVVFVVASIASGLLGGAVALKLHDGSCPKIVPCYSCPCCEPCDCGPECCPPCHDCPDSPDAEEGAALDPPEQPCDVTHDQRQDRRMNALSERINWHADNLNFRLIKVENWLADFAGSASDAPLWDPKPITAEITR